MALIDELKERRERQTESLATIYEAIRERQEYLRGVEFELEDLDRAIAALEAPAQPHGELRDAPPAASEESGDQIGAPIERPWTLASAFYDGYKGRKHVAPQHPVYMEQWLAGDNTRNELTAEAVERAHAEWDQIEASDQPEKVEALTLPGGVEESRDQPCTCHPDDAPLECMKRYAASECQAAYGAKYFPPPPAEDFTLLDRAVLRDEPDGVEAEPEGYAPVVDAEAVLDATELAQVTIDKVPPTAEVIKDQTGRAKFALFGGQTHEVVEPSNTEADFWARVLHPRKREEA